VTETVRAIRTAMREVRSRAVLSAAVYPTAKAREKVHQDAEGWVREGLVDWVFPMTYNDSDEEHRAEVEEGYDLFRAGGVVTQNGRSVVSREGRPLDTVSVRSVCIPGIGVYKHQNAEQTLRHIRMCRSGYALFAYSCFFETSDETRQEDAELRRARREMLLQIGR
jgi:uncharacterized lipoprotein YddW (UPF0748 family)